MNQQQTRRHVESSARWQKAAERAVHEGVQVRQLQGSGQWIASSGSDQTTAYELNVTGSIAHGCDCLAGLNNDPVCKHRAAFYILVGALGLDPEPEGSPPAPGVAPVVCFRCRGVGAHCPVCAGSAALATAAQAAEHRPAMVAEPEPAPFRAEPSEGFGFVGRAGHVAGYDVLIAGDRLLVTHAATGREWRHVVPHYGTALAQLAQEPGLCLGWAQFPDDAEAIYLFDADDGCFGFAMNLSDPSLSEWGYSPFAAEEDRTLDGWGRTRLAA